MFANISLNEKSTKGKGINSTTLKMYNHQCNLGRNEWQQNWNTVNHQDFSFKNLNGNRFIIDKPYMKSNYSGFEIKSQSNESGQQFLTSNKRDFISFSSLNKEKESKKNDFVNASKIVLGEYSQKTISTYKDNHDNLKSRGEKNYDKIKFHYDEYNIHPITSELMPKKNNWGFEYFNRDKIKNANSYDKPNFLNKDFTRSYNPITNRYLN